MTDTLREKALSPEEAEFARLVARGMAEALDNEQWLSGTASIKLTPFALDGLAHSFGLILDKYDAALAEIEKLREACGSAAAQIRYLHDKLGFETGSGNAELARLDAFLKGAPNAE